MSGSVQRALVGMIGKAGSGKSTSLRAHSARCRRLIVIDCEDAWELQDGDELAQGFDALTRRLEELDATDPAVPFRLVYRDREELLAVAPWKVAFAVGHVTLVCDEIAWLCTASHLPRDLKAVIQFGRRYHLNLLYTTRQPQEVHNILLDQAGCLQFFRMEPGLGLDRIRRNYPAIATLLPQFNGFPGPGSPPESCIYGDSRFFEFFGNEGLDFELSPVASSPRSPEHARSRHS